MRLAFSVSRFFTLLLLLLTLASSSFAHDHSLATWEISPGPGQSMSLRVSFVQAAAHEALFAKHGRDSIMGISRAEYEDLVVAYIQERTTLKVGGAPLVLEESERQIESHASLVVFSLNSEGITSEGFEAELLAFTESSRQRQLLRVMGPEGAVLRESTLHRGNGYRAQLTELGREEREGSFAGLTLAQKVLRGALALVVLAALLVLWLELRPPRSFS